MCHRLRTATMLVIHLAFGLSVYGVDFSTLGDGDWNNPATWTPSGIPGSLDRASIGSTTPGIAATVATVTLTSDETVRTVLLGRGRDTMGTLVLQGVLTVTDTITVGQINGIGIITHDGGHFETDGLDVALGNTIGLAAADRVRELAVSTGSQVNTSSAANIADRVILIEAGSGLDLGAPLSLMEDLDIRGSSGIPAVVRAHGHDITARDIFIGRNGNSGELLDDGAIRATRDLEVSAGSFVLDADDRVERSLIVTNGGQLTLHPNTAATKGSIFGGSTLNTAGVGNISSLIDILNPGSTLNLNAPLNLSQDLTIRGDPSSAARVQANGHSVTARNVFIGRAGDVGELLNDGPIVATQDLTVSRNTFSLDNNDSVARNVTVSRQGTLNLHANTAAAGGLVFSGSTLNIVSTSNISTMVDVFDGGSTLHLAAPLDLADDLEIRGSGTTAAIVQANGHSITARDIFIGRMGNRGDVVNDGAIVARRDLEVSGRFFTLDADDQVGRNLITSNGATVTLHPNTSATGGTIFGGSTVTLVSTGNFSTLVNVLDPGSTLNLTAPISLTDDLVIYGNGSTAAVVQAAGHDVTARDILVGRFNQVGSLRNSGRLTAHRNLIVERSVFDVDGGFDVVGSALNVFRSSTMTVNQDADGARGLSLEGGTLSVLDTSVLRLEFDAAMGPVGDWIFRWANPPGGDRVATINGLIASGRIVVDSTHPYFVADAGNGYTYVANFAADFNGDQQLNCTDINLLTAAIVDGSSDPMFDLDNDGMITTADRDVWLAGAGSTLLPSGAPFLPGDADLDGTVDGTDFGIWNTNSFTSNSAWCDGDFNTDGAVDGSDFGIWNVNKFRASGGRAAVPEPVYGGWWLVILAGIRGWSCAWGSGGPRD